MLRRTQYIAAPISIYHQHKKSPKRVEGLPYKHSLVIAHGMLGNSNNWSTAANTLLAACDAASESGAPMVTDVYQVDMRNHGKSSWSDRHTVWDMAGDLEKFCQDVVRLEGVDNKVVVVGHSMGGVALMHSIVRRHNRAHYRSMEALSDEEMGIQGSMEEIDGEEEEGGARPYPLMLGESGPTSTDTTSPLIVGGVVVDIVPLSKADMVAVTEDPTRLGGVVSTLAVMQKLDPTTVNNNKEADAFFKDNGVDDTMMRQFILTNLSLDIKAPSNNKWKCNIDVLYRDVHQLYLPDEPPASGGTATKVDLDAFPVSFVYGGASHYYGSTERAVSYLDKYFTNIRSEEDVPLPTTTTTTTTTDPLPNVMVVPKVGHNVHYESPKEFTKKVMPMLQRCFQR